MARGLNIPENINAEEVKEMAMEIQLTPYVYVPRHTNNQSEEESKSDEDSQPTTVFSETTDREIQQLMADLREIAS